MPQQFSFLTQVRNIRHASDITVYYAKTSYTQFKLSCGVLLEVFMSSYVPGFSLL